MLRFLGFGLALTRSKNGSCLAVQFDDVASSDFFYVESVVRDLRHTYSHNTDIDQICGLWETSHGQAFVITTGPPRSHEVIKGRLGDSTFTAVSDLTERAYEGIVDTGSQRLLLEAHPLSDPVELKGSLSGVPLHAFRDAGDTYLQCQHDESETWEDNVCILPGTASDAAVYSLLKQHLKSQVIQTSSSVNDLLGALDPNLHVECTGVKWALGILLLEL